MDCLPSPSGMPLTEPNAAGEGPDALLRLSGLRHSGVVDLGCHFPGSLVLSPTKVVGHSPRRSGQPWGPFNDSLQVASGYAQATEQPAGVGTILHHTPYSRLSSCASGVSWTNVLIHHVNALESAAEGMAGERC